VAEALPAGGKLERGGDQRGLRFLCGNILGRQDAMSDWRTTANRLLFMDYGPAIRSFTKWYFDLIKNALVVAALVYTWKKTNDAIVGVVATLTFAIFVSYILTYPLAVVYEWRPYIQSLSPLRWWLVAVPAAIFVAVSTLAIGEATMEVMNAIFHAQGAIK
jgi:hypothetical protein